MIDPSELSRIIKSLVAGTDRIENITKALNEKDVREELNVLTNSDTKSKKMCSG